MVPLTPLSQIFVAGISTLLTKTFIERTDHNVSVAGCGYAILTGVTIALISARWKWEGRIIGHLIGCVSAHIIFSILKLSEPSNCVSAETSAISMIAMQWIVKEIIFQKTYLRIECEDGFYAGGNL